MNKIALFSGRFDPVHLGHIITIGRLLEKYQQVIVCILDHSGRESVNIEVIKNIYETFIRLWAEDKRRIEVVTNETHFAYIEKSEIKQICKKAWVKDISNVVYVSGNEEVNKHIKSIGFPVEYIPRSYFYRATSIRELLKDIKEFP
jgi:cytidyltransferase-like protein